MLNINEMKDLLDRIIEAKYKENGFYYDSPERPKPAAPASEEQLKQLDDHFAKKGLQVPPSYRQFLSIYNGIEHIFGPYLSLSPVADVTRDDYGLIPEIIEEAPSCVKFIISTNTITMEIVTFDVATAAPEYEVVWISDEGHQDRFKNFEDMLQSYLAICERNVSLKEKENKSK